MDVATIFLFNSLQKIKYLAKTGISVDIHKLGKNKRCLAVKEIPFDSEIYPSVFLKKYSEQFSAGNFTNIYDLYWDPKQTHLIPEITSSNTPYFLNDHIQANQEIIATINGAFFFLSDVADREPVDLPYNFCIRQGRIIGLPSADDPIIYIENKKLFTRPITAKGSMKIGTTIIKWVGAKSRNSKETSCAVLYNSSCSDVVKSRDPLTNIQIGVLDSENITTPFNNHLTDIVIGRNKKGDLSVIEINPFGGTHFFAGNFILQVKKGTFKVGDIVQPLTLDGLNLAKIEDGLTIGKSILDEFFEESIRSDRKDARSVIAEDVKGMLHLITFDGSKYIPGFHGVSALDIQDLFKKTDFNWAYFLDGGGSSRMVVRKNNKLQSYANQFAFQKFENGWVKWDWERSRKITSSISLRLNLN